MLVENCKVRLVTFNGTKNPQEETESSENYWKLLGQEGNVIQSPSESGIYASFSPKKRVLVKFDCSIDELGLECHNEISNTLWILETDLQLISKR